MMFIRVLLPAPFSPTMAKISPFSTENEMLSFARFPGNILEMLRTSSAFMASLPYNGGEGRCWSLLAPESSCHGLTAQHGRKLGPSRPRLPWGRWNYGAIDDDCAESAFVLPVWMA